MSVTIPELADRIAAALVARLSPEDQRAALVQWNMIGREVAHRLEARREILARNEPPPFSRIAF